MLKAALCLIARRSQQVTFTPRGKYCLANESASFFKSINEGQIKSFCKEWGQKVREDDFFCSAATSISSYSEMNSFVKFGSNRDGEKLPQINLVLLYNQKSELPAYYDQLPGSSNDVQTLSIKELIRKMGTRYRITSGKHGHLNTVETKAQQQIMETLGIKPPS